MAGILRTAYRETVKDRKFLKSMEKSILQQEKNKRLPNHLKVNEYITPSMVDRYNFMNSQYPRVRRNPIINTVNWMKAFMDNLSKIGSRLNQNY